MGKQASINNLSTQSRISHRPKFFSPEPKFYICQQCGTVFTQMKSDNNNISLTCCGQAMNELIPNLADETNEDHMSIYTIGGGFTNNAIRTYVGRADHAMTEEHHIEWVYLYTFQGGQFKYLELGKLPTALFAMADYDAYVYCDRPICKMGHDHCMFKCKRGLVLYAYCNQHGLWKTPL